jgi:hypothetical protein
MRTAITRITFAIAIIVATQGTASAQLQTQPHATTTTSDNARYEIVQSQLAARWTFRLDRKCGGVSQLVRTAEDENAWESMSVIGLDECKSDRVAHFQIFSSGLAAKHTFLMDTSTGKTWTLTTLTGRGGTETMAWVLFVN